MPVIKIIVLVLFNHVTYCYSLVNRRGLFAYAVRTSEHAKPDLIHWTTKFILTTLPFNLVISSFPDNMLLIYHDSDQWFQQRCSSLFVHHAMNSLFQHACEQACQQHCSSCLQLDHVQACQQAKTSCGVFTYVVVTQNRQLRDHLLFRYSKINQDNRYHALIFALHKCRQK